MSDPRSTDKSDVTGAPIDIHKERTKQKATEDALKKGKDLVDKAQEVIRKKYGPPGTP